MSQNLSNSRSSVTEEALRKWFSEVLLHMTRLELVEIDPSRIYNCDESAFFVSQRRSSYCTRGSKTAYEVTDVSDKENLTVLITVSAAGILTPPMVLYRKERMPAKIRNSLPKDWMAGVTERG